MRYLITPKNGDPSAVQQHFVSFQADLLCAHYWWLDVWKHENLAFPYWRIYWNNNPGAGISFGGQRWELGPNKVALIAPNTSFSTDYDPSSLAIDRPEYCMGGPLSSRKEGGDSVLEHLFIHFNLKSPFDQIKPAVHMFDANDYLQNLLRPVCRLLKNDPANFGRDCVLKLHALIAELLCRIPDNEWLVSSSDKRVQSILTHIDLHLSEKLSNESLAKRAHMATNSFARLFKEEIGSSLQQYILRRRIDKSCVMLHHRDCSIEAIAEQCGFCDRYHFSRMFKKHIHRSPVEYRHSGMKKLITSNPVN